MLSYFIVAHCTFMKNFSSKLKSRFQVDFSQDPFPLTMVSWVHFWPAFYCRTLRTVSLLMDEGMLALTITLFTKIHLYILLSAWFVARYFSFVEQTVLPSFFISLQMVAFDTSSMISSLIFLNKFFLHLDADSTSS